MQPVPASSLNPDAGSHAVTADPLEVEAAVRAGDETVRRVPYFLWRYGERGRRFGHSDSAWLVNLVSLPQTVVDQQIGWLGNLLSNRGMPQLLLERHLLVLHDALEQTLPGKASEYAKLRAAAEMLRRQRTRILSDEAMKRIGAVFEAAAGDEWRHERERAGVGELLAAAVADEQTGVVNAVTSLTGWLTDPARFSERWVAAVRQAVSAARDQAHPR